MLGSNKLLWTCMRMLLMGSWLVAIGARAAQKDEIDAELEKISHWDNTFNLRTWSGYKDNVLFGHEHAVESAFVAAGFDALLWRLPDNGWEYLILGSGEYIRYVPGQQVDKEATALAQVQVKKE